MRFQIKKLDNDPDTPFWVLPQYGGGYDAPNVRDHPDFHIDGEPAPQWHRAEGQIPAAPYRELFGSADIVDGNLRSSYSGLCLAGRSAGGLASKEVCSQILLSDGSGEYDLSGLLTVHGWSESRVSRMTFFNARTGELDRNVSEPTLVVADGDASFLQVLDRAEFQRSHVIGLVQRAMEREKLEAVGIRMAQCSQWYEHDTDMLCNIPSPPRGISVSILRRRS